MGRLLLVRHGQASFGADDYDVLSDVGWEQARRLGLHLRDRGVVAHAVVHGELRRQRDTAAALTGAAGWDVTARTDARWDELDHLSVLSAYGDPDHQELDRRAFQEAFEHATGRWSAGEAPDVRPDGPDVLESYTDFVGRVRGALDAAADLAGPGATVVAVSSGGAIAAAAALLLGASGTGLPAVWSRLNTVLVNSSHSTVVVGGTGARLLTWNEHSHVSGDLLTYR
jgi:broad specificity phosphatase PhoE